MQAPQMYPSPPTPTRAPGGPLLGRKPAGGERQQRVASPWEDMTYTWVAEQDYNFMIKQQQQRSKHGRKTEEWVFKQAHYFPGRDDGLAPITLVQNHQAPGHRHHHRSANQRRDAAGAIGARLPPQPPSPLPRRRTQPEWEELIYRYEVDAERWMRHEEESRRMAEERLRARTRLEDELRRIDERIRQHKEEQRRMLEESRTAGQREQERKERAVQLERAVADGWERYEARWSEISSSSEPLTYANIPWPTVVVPKTVEDISASAITAFLLSAAHSQKASKKERIRSAQLRWHPDRFRRLMGRVCEEEKAAVEEGVGSVARVLNDLMQREAGNSK